MMIDLIDKLLKAGKEGFLRLFKFTSSSVAISLKPIKSDNQSDYRQSWILMRLSVNQSVVMLFL